MKNGAVVNLMFTAFAFAFFSVLLPVSARGSDSDDLTLDGVEELRLREDAAAREANETALAEIESIKAIKKTRYIDEEPGYMPEVNLVSDDELAEIEKQRAEKVNAIQATYGYDINSLKQEEAGVSEERTAGVSRKASAMAKPVPHGTVTGIVLYNNRGAVIIAGEIARENDSVFGVKVVRITADYVEFEKQGKTWKQQVGQPPPESVWEKPGKSSKTSKASPGN